MAFLKLTSLVGSALLILQLHGAVSLPEEESDTATQVNCLEEMNKLRSAVGFAPFKQATDLTGPRKMLPTTETRGLWSGEVHLFCEGIYRDNNPKSHLLEPDEGYTFAYDVQYGEKANCKTAIDHWIAVGKKAGAFAPRYESDEIPPYNVSEERSFVALFNPQPNPLIDCAYFRCPLNEWRPKPDITPAPVEPLDPQDPDHHHPEGLKSAPVEKVYGKTALVCVTYPPPLIKDKYPFTDEQFIAIMSHIRDSSP